MRKAPVGEKMFGKKKKTVSEIPYDPLNQRAVLKCSICTGEQVAGFKDIRTGKFTEVMLIRDQGGLDTFMERYALASVAKEY